MQKCEKCHMKFRWIDIYKLESSLSKRNDTLSCKNCETEHKISLESKIIRTVMIAFTAGISTYLALILDTSHILSLLSFITFFLMLRVIICAISPFLYRFHSKYHSNYKVLK